MRTSETISFCISSGSLTLKAQQPELLEGRDVLQGVHDVCIKLQLEMTHVTNIAVTDQEATSTTKSLIFHNCF